MDYSQILLAFGPIVLSGIISAYVAMKITQSVMGEKIKNIKDNFDEYRAAVRADIVKLQSDTTDMMLSCRVNQNEKMEVAMDYIKRVEINKADRTEVALVIAGIARVEEKLDQLLLRGVK